MFGLLWLVGCALGEFDFAAGEVLAFFLKNDAVDELDGAVVFRIRFEEFAEMLANAEDGPLAIRISEGSVGIDGFHRMVFLDF